MTPEEKLLLEEIFGEYHDNGEKMRLVYKCGHSYSLRGPRGTQRESPDICWKCKEQQYLMKPVDWKTATVITEEYYDDEENEIWDPTEDEALDEHIEAIEEENQSSD